MINSETKQKLLKEIEKFGNVYLSCQKLNIDKSTYYRWKEKNEKFRVVAEKSEAIGRENIGEVAEYSLLQNIKEKNERAIEFALTHISKKYKQDRTTNVIFMHKKDVVPLVPQKTLEDILDEESERMQSRTTQIIEKYEALGGIPPKADGREIAFNEIEKYEAYIEEYYKKKRLETIDSLPIQKSSKDNEYDNPEKNYRDLL